MKNHPWWRHLPTRLLEEEAALQELYAAESRFLLSHRWTTAEGEEARLLAQIQVGQRAVGLEVRFPHHYPEGCPSVRPIPYDTRVSTHQFKSGVLCLELGPDNWHPDYTAAAMLRSACKLVLYERINEIEPIEIPSRHLPNLAERVALAASVLLRSAEFDARVASAVELTSFETVWIVPHYKQFLPIAFPVGSPLPFPAAMRTNGHPFPAKLVCLRDGAPSTVPETAPEFISFVDTYGGVALDEKMVVVALRWPDGCLRAFLKTPDALMKLEDVPLDAAAATERITGRLYEELARRKIGIVGAGSLGSKIAVSLARSGTSRFVLVDGDVLLGENICRHQGTFRDVGVMKVDVVERLIREVSAQEPEIEKFTVNVGSAINPEYHAKVLESLAGCDVLVDATATPDVFGILAGLASDHCRPLAWAEVFAGGLGGLVGSAHPERDPCPRCVRAGFLAAAAAWPPAPFVRAGNDYASEDSSALVATDAAVGIIASVLTNRIETLIAGDEATVVQVLLLGLRREWIFDAAFHTVPVHVRSDDRSCARCWRLPSDLDLDTLASAERLFTNDAHAHDPSVA